MEVPAGARYRQGLLQGRLEAMEPGSRTEAEAGAVTREALSAAERNAALRERAGRLPLNHRQLRVLELLSRGTEETLTAARWARINHSTREEAEAGIDGMVQAMLLEESPQESINPRYRLARGGGPRRPPDITPTHRTERHNRLI
jgi:hypothetical protein